MEVAEAKELARSRFRAAGVQRLEPGTFTFWVYRGYGASPDACNGRCINVVPLTNVSGDWVLGAEIRLWTFGMMDRWLEDSGIENGDVMAVDYQGKKPGKDGRLFHTANFARMTLDEVYGD